MATVRGKCVVKMEKALNCIIGMCREKKILGFVLSVASDIHWGSWNVCPVDKGILLSSAHMRQQQLLHCSPNTFISSHAALLSW